MLMHAISLSLPGAGVHGAAINNISRRKVKWTRAAELDTLFLCEKCIHSHEYVPMNRKHRCISLDAQIKMKMKKKQAKRHKRRWNE